MQPLTTSAQFRQEAQQLIQQIESKMNDLSNSAYNNRNQAANQPINEEMERLQKQRAQLQAALNDYGTLTENNWSAIQSKAQYALEEVSNNWVTDTQASPSNSDRNTETDKWQVSTGQSDRGEYGSMPGLGDRAGMEDPQSGLNNETQYSSFGNPQKDQQQEHSKKNKLEENINSNTSYEQIQANDRQRQNEDEEGLSRTNRGGDATQDDPGGSADKGDENSDYIFPDKRESDKKQEAGNRPWDSRSM